MYLATRSDLAKEPVLICVDCVATARSAIKVSSVSPDLWEITVLKLFFFASSMTFRVSVKVPIWFTLISIELADFSFIPLFNLATLVTNKSSPTIWIFLPISFVSLDQAFQSFSAKGSSIDLLGYLEINFL